MRTTLNGRKELIQAMDVIAHYVNDDNYFLRWATVGVPDGETEEDIAEDAKDEHTFAEYVDVFNHIFLEKDARLWVPELNNYTSLYHD